MTVSTLTGRRQAIWLRHSIRVLAVLAAAGFLVPGSIGSGAANLAVVLLIAVPLVRVVGIVIRLAAEHDSRFVVTGIALLSAVALGVLISVFLRS